MYHSGILHGRGRRLLVKCCKRRYHVTTKFKIVGHL
jgi:hypothetical protein